MLDKKYNAKKVEEGKYEYWKNAGYFNSGDKNKEPFCIVIPPPNVTGVVKITPNDTNRVFIRDLRVSLGLS